LKKELLISIVLLVSIASAHGQDKPERYVDTKGGFSFDLPRGWQAYEMPNAKYKVVFGQRENGFTPNITIEDDACLCPLSEYVDLAQQRFETNSKKAGFAAVKLLTKAEFITSSGQKGWRLTNAGTGSGVSLVFRQYVFSSGDKKQFIFTCGALAESAARLESVCDGAMKTLTFAESNAKRVVGAGAGLSSLLSWFD